MRVGELKAEYEKERSVPLQPRVMLQSMQIAAQDLEQFPTMHEHRADTCCCGSLLAKRITLEGITYTESEGGKT